MSIYIEEVFNIEIESDHFFAVVQHNGIPLHAILCGPYEKLIRLVRTDVTAEYELKYFDSVESNLPKDDSASGFFPIDDTQLVIDGTVHNEVPIDKDSSYFDIYIQNGADFLCVRSDVFRDKPQLDTRIRITGRCLLVYPNMT